MSNRPVPLPPVSADVFAAPGPVVSVQLTTEGALPQAAQRVALRWKTLRAELAADGAPEAALAAVDPLVDDAHAAGETLFAVAGPDGLRYAAHLPELPEADGGRVGPLPHLVPLLEATQKLLPHVVVVTDRLGAELVAVLPDRPDARVEVEGTQLHVTRSAPGGWSQRRFQQRAENRWEANAREVCYALTRLVDATAPRLVVVSGDVRAVQFLREHLPVRVLERLAEVQGDYGDLDEALRRSERLVADVAAADTAAVLDDLQQGRPGGTAVAGPDDTLATLAAGQVATLLVEPTRAVDHTAWFGPEPVQVASTAAALRAAGVADPQPAPLADVAIRAAIATAAAVRIVPPDAPDLDAGGVAALLRYR